MIKRALFLITAAVFIFCVTLQGQSVKKGLGNLEKSEFDKARETFSKILESDPKNPAANFGMAMVYSSTVSPYYNLLTAWSYCCKTNENIASLNTDDETALSEYFLNIEVRKTNRPVKKKIDIAINDVDARLIKYIREENNLDMVNQVLADFPDYDHYQNVVHIRNYLEFRKVEKINTIQAYNDYIKKFPDAAQIPQAVEKRNTLVFNNAMKQNTLTAINDFLLNYPDAKEYYLAVKQRNELAFVDSKQKNTIEAFESYITKYPDAIQIPEAKKLLMVLVYEKAKSIRTIEAYNDFIRKYPEGAQFIDIFNLKAMEIGRRFMLANQYPADRIAFVRGFDNSNYSDNAGSIINTPDGNILIGGTTNIGFPNGYDAWMFKLKPDGNLVWNQIVGNEGDDEINAMEINSLGELITAGKKQSSLDSSRCEAWLFKLGSDGSRIWTRSMNLPEFTAITNTMNDNIILGGYSIKNDTTDTVNFYIAKLNYAGKKLWTRDYTNIGRINALALNSTGDIIACGGNWIFCIDNMGYIKWEKYFAPSDSITSVAFSNETIYVGGLRRPNQIWVTTLGSGGITKWEKTFQSTGVISIVTSIETYPATGDIYIAGNSANDGFLIQLDPMGKMVWNGHVGTSDFESVKGLIVTNSGMPIMLLTHKDFKSEDIIVVAYNR